MCLLILSSPVQAQAQETIPTDLEIEIHRLINDVRADKEMHNQDLARLKLHSDLIDVARTHSQDMLERDFFAHTNPDGEEPADRVEDAGIEWSSVGENLFFSESVSEKNLAEEAVDGWVDSPGHYANIIAGYAFTGIGVASQGDTYYVTQVFINADPNHLDNIGVIYENDKLDDLQPQESSFQITAEMAAILVVIGLVLLGLDANRRNNRYYGRR